MNSNWGSNENDRQVRELLKESIPHADAELSRDLWPQMLDKLGDRTAPWHARVAWFDWVLAALAVGALAVFPGIIPALFYHL